MEFINQYKDVAEFIYYLTGPLVLIGIIVALFQLKAFKEESATRFKRETIATTLKVLEQKLDQIEQATNAAIKDDAWDERPDTQHQSLGYSLASSKLNKEWLEWYRSDSTSDLRDGITISLNIMEGLAHYIFSGITDEELCYKLEHTRVMYFLEEMREYWVECREQDDSTIYEGIHHLYILWKQKIHHDTNQKELVLAAKKASSQPRPKAALILGVGKTN